MNSLYSDIFYSFYLHNKNVQIIYQLYADFATSIDNKINFNKIIYLSFSVSCFFLNVYMRNCVIHNIFQ